MSFMVCYFGTDAQLSPETPADVATQTRDHRDSSLSCKNLNLFVSQKEKKSDAEVKKLELQDKVDTRPKRTDKNEIQH